MSEPFYVDQRHQITLYCDDALRLTPWLKAEGLLPGQTITITDPPYNVGMNYGPEVDDKRAQEEYFEWCREWYEMVPKPLVLTPGFVNFEMWAGYIDWPTGIVPWIKPNQSKKPFAAWQWFNVWEPILFYGKTPANPKQDVILTPIGQQPEVQRHAWNGTTNRHPCPKYLPFWLKLIGNIWKPGWTLYDPFVGSGSTLIAAKRLGIPAIGVEKKREYCELTVERLQQEVMDVREVAVDDTVNYRLDQQRLNFEAQEAV